jgi:hypothetical protein
MYLGATSPAVRRRQKVEVTILRRVIREALKQGYEIAVYDGEERFPASNKFEVILSHAYNTDEDILFFIEEGREVGWVKFVYGNDGWDVISDYLMSLESFMKPIHQWVDEKFA